MKKHQITISSPEPLNIQQIGYGFTISYGNTPPEQISISMQSEGGEEPKPSFKKWRAENGGNYFTIHINGEIVIATEKGNHYDNYRYLTNNYFQTEQEAKAYKARQEAIGRVTHAIIEANEGWEPDWENHAQWKSTIKYDRVSKQYQAYSRSWLHVPINIPWCKNDKIALSIISSHKEDLDLIFNVGASQ